MSAAGNPNPAPHPVLNQPDAAKEMILRHQQHRSQLLRAVENCTSRGEQIPEELMEAIVAMAGDAALRPRSDPNSPSRSSRLNVSRITKTTLDHKAEAAPSPAPEDHVNMTYSAVSNASHVETSGNLTMPKVSVKLLLEDAYSARRAGDRAGEVRALLRYLELGQRGDVPFDTSATFRVFRQLGDAYSAIKDLVSAEHFYFDWYLAADKVGDDAEAARALLQLGRLHQANGDLQKAQEWFVKAQSRNIVTKWSYEQQRRPTNEGSASRPARDVSVHFPVS